MIGKISVGGEGVGVRENRGRDGKSSKRMGSGRNKYTLFDGLAYNTCGYFASCVVFFRAMSKMSARIIC